MVKTIVTKETDAQKDSLLEENVGRGLKLPEAQDMRIMFTTGRGILETSKEDGADVALCHLVEGRTFGADYHGLFKKCVRKCCHSLGTAVALLSPVLPGDLKGCPVEIGASRLFLAGIPYNASVFLRQPCRRSHCTGIVLETSLENQTTTKSLTTVLCAL